MGQGSSEPPPAEPPPAAPSQPQPQSQSDAAAESGWFGSFFGGEAAPATETTEGRRDVVRKKLAGGPVFHDPPFKAAAWSSDADSEGSESMVGQLHYHSEMHVLCPYLIVLNETDCSFMVTGATVMPHQQNDVLKLFQLSADHEKPLIRIYISEEGSDSGIMCESSIGTQVGVIDTSKACVAAGEEKKRLPRHLRRAAIAKHSAMPDQEFEPYAVVTCGRGSSHLFEVHTGGAEEVDGQLEIEGELIFKVFLSDAGRSARLTNENDVLVGSCDTKPNRAGRHIVLTIGVGTDLAIALCIILAAVKLSHVQI